MVHEHRRTTHTSKAGHYVCAVCDFNSRSKQDLILREHLRFAFFNFTLLFNFRDYSTEHNLEMVDVEVDQLVKYPCPCCEAGFRWKGELVDHLRSCKREERTRIIRYRLDKLHLPLVNQASAARARSLVDGSMLIGQRVQVLWPRARTEQTSTRVAGAAQASKMPLIAGEAPLAGECTMPNGQAATLCVQLGGPDGAFALIKRPLPVDPSRQMYGVRRPPMVGVPSAKFGGMATNQLQQQVARQRQLQVGRSTPR